MFNKLIASACILVACTISNPIVAKTLKFESLTADKHMDGSYEIQKTSPMHWMTAGGVITGHKIQSQKKPSFLPGLLTYEGLQAIQQKGRPPVNIYFLGLSVSQTHEYGTYYTIDPKTNTILGHGNYTYDK